MPGQTGMAYRSDDDAEAERLRALSAQMAELELRLAERNVLRAHRQRVGAQLKDATANRRAKVPLPLLARIRVASPCHERWDRMTGDERVRHCAACDKDVYDLSEMTAAEAEDLLLNVGEAACVRLHRRADGTVITSDCPVGAKKKRRNRVLAAGAAIAGSAFAATTALLTTAAGEKAPITTIEPAHMAMGAVAMNPPEEVAPLPDYSLMPMAGGPMFVPPPDEVEETDDGDVETDRGEHRPRRRRARSR